MTTELERSAADVWMVQAVIRPFKLDVVTRALEAVQGFTGMTVMDVRGFGREKVSRDRADESGRREAVREIMDDFVPQVCLQVAVVGEAVADDVVGIIIRTARTGNPGDGKVFTWRLARTIRVRTGEEASERGEEDR